MIIRSGASRLRIFAYLVSRPMIPVEAGQAEVASILNLNISWIAFASLFAEERIYLV